MDSEQFSRLFKAAIGTVAAQEGRTASAVEESLLPILRIDQQRMADFKSGRSLPSGPVLDALVQRGLADVKAGRTKPARQVFARLRRKRGLPR